MNNCGYNPIHTDYVGGSAEYPNASSRARPPGRHILTTFKGTYGSCRVMRLSKQRASFANIWGLCGDEFVETGHFPPQLYVREARRMVGMEVFRQGDVGKRPLGTRSIGMGFDSHCVKRHACTGRACTTRTRTRRGNAE